MKSLKKYTTNLIILWLCSFMALGGCKTTGFGSPPPIGPPPSSEMLETDDQTMAEAEVAKAPRLDVIVPVFDPNLPDPNDKKKKDKDEGLWPEVRRAEANRFAYKMKQALEETDSFGAVRVTPDATATGEIYVQGKILESNGMDVEIEITVTDISGHKWFSKKFSYEVDETFFATASNKGKDPYEPVFVEAAQYIVEELKDQDAKRAEDLQRLAKLRFGANFSEAYFAEYIEEKRGKVYITAYPDSEDAMLNRLEAIRYRDQMFVDGLQDNYRAFNDKMNESYTVWQESALNEQIALAEVRKKSFGKAVGGILLVALGVGLAVASGNGNAATQTTGAIAGVTLGVVGAAKLMEAADTAEEAEFHKESLNELGKSLDIELGPQVVEFNDQTEEITGSAKEQFGQWREFLQRIYEQEKTPDVQL
ncbi:hypothetical protein [Pseudodesulfovibrio sp. zrk46]|uniref:hypothetical protein n=1 Tax=Pseudodesulfovibrio sp. zrk46 TaxID=2725288 RepID=UPI0014496892|nr:hypothetical protein [Pseudodesulfovibrio sp. zrk46]QJB56888.1 hypothetical protein HFN16_10950 [Pseudodesulfovibrio sp. zrk46]